MFPYLTTAARRYIYSHSTTQTFYAPPEDHGDQQCSYYVALPSISFALFRLAEVHDCLLSILLSNMQGYVPQP